ERASPAVYERRFHASGGVRRFSVAFTNDFYDPKSADPSMRDRNLVLDWVEVVGPLDEPPPPPPSHRRIFSADPGGADVERRGLPRPRRAGPPQADRRPRRRARRRLPRPVAHASAARERESRPRALPDRRRAAALRHAARDGDALRRRRRRGPQRPRPRRREV